MIVKSGKYGKFLACPNYPECSSILPIDAKLTEEKCLDCGSAMLLKKGRYGAFLECPKCGAKRPQNGTDGNDKVEGVCPDCGKPMRRMRSKTGKIYYGCTGYPACKFLSWDAPTGTKCPKCGKYLVKRNGRIHCSEKSCDYTEELKENES